MRDPAEIEQEYNYFGNKPVTTVNELPSNTKELKDDSFIFEKNNNDTEITLHIFKDNAFWRGPTFTKE